MPCSRPSGQHRQARTAQARPAQASPAAARAVLLAGAALATAALAAACSSGSSPAPAANSSATITAVGAENEYANVIGQVGGKYVHVSAIESNPNTDPHTFEASAERGPADQQRRPGRAERPGLRHVHEQDRGRGPERGAQGHRRPAPARPAGQHAQPAPVVQAVHDAGRGEGRGRGPVGPPARPPGVLRRQGAPPSTASLQPWYQPIAAVQGALPGDAGGDHRAGRRLPAAGRGHPEPHPVRLPGRRHERRGPGPAVRLAPGRPVLRAQGQGVPVQPAGDRLADLVVPGCRRSGTGSPWSACTRPCRNRATTTSPG